MTLFSTTTAVPHVTIVLTSTWQHPADFLPEQPRMYMLIGRGSLAHTPIAAYGAILAPYGAGGMGPAPPQDMPYGAGNKHNSRQRMGPSARPLGMRSSWPAQHGATHHGPRERSARGRFNDTHTIAIVEDTHIAGDRFSAPRQRGYNGDPRSRTICSDISYTTNKSKMSPITRALAMAHQGMSSPQNSVIMHAHLKELEFGNKRDRVNSKMSL